MRLLTCLALAMCLVAGSGCSDKGSSSDKDNTLVMELKNGKVLVKLRPDLAPKHVERIKQLAGEGFYDGVKFHRVIPGFMAQTGDPTGTGAGGSKKPNLKAEFSRERHVRGTCAMARSNSPDSANSQFFVCFDTSPWLDGKYTVWGRVTEGMEHIDAIKKGDENNNGSVVDPDKVISMTLP